MNTHALGKVMVLALGIGLIAPGEVKLHGQTADTGQESAASGGWQVRERGPHHTVWERVTETTDLAGRVVLQTNSYQEFGNLPERVRPAAGPLGALPGGH